MPIELRLCLADLAGTRFAVSPLSETVSGLQQLGGHARAESNLRWVRWAAEELAERHLAMPRTWPLIVNDLPSWPEFLLPAPTGPITTIEDSLEAVQRTTARQVRASLTRVFGDALPPAAAALAAHPTAELRAITAELRQAHDRLIAPHWSRIRAVLDADVGYRARQLAFGGTDRLFADLHRDLRWHAGTLTVHHRDRAKRAVVARGGLVLVPVVLGPPYVVVKGNTTTQTTIRYPARGAGALWTVGTRPIGQGLVRLVGKPRARILEALRSPSTTTELANALDITPSAVSQHLRVLRENRLVASERHGRNVLHLNTAQGNVLAEQAFDQPVSPNR